MSFSAIADAANAIQRLTVVFQAETLTETRIIDDTLDLAVQVKNASFTWDAPPPEAGPDKSKSKPSKRHSKRQGQAQVVSKPDFEENEKPSFDNVFRMSNVSLTIPKGQLVAVVGAVGSGKTSLLQGMIGEMRRTLGSVTFGASVGYCPQSAWIQVCSLLLFLSSHLTAFSERDCSRKHLFRSAV